MSRDHLVVDGSNIATEGRSEPSLDQLESAVAELRREFPDVELTVVVDATFAHRIDAKERDRFEAAVLRGEYVQPPAGAIGRGDAFLLRIAEKVDAVVCSNDSFQEFHGEHPWLFDRGRLIGATPVQGVGWIFSPRTPVRGPTSRRAVRGTEQAKRKVTKAIEVATKEAAPRQPVAPSVAAVNDPLTFISFIADHPLGTEVEGVVDSYTSHGAVVFIGPVQCYLPLAAMADPAPRSAREVVKRHEKRPFVVTALDPQRRGVELAIPGVAPVSGRPSEAMVAAEVKIAKKAAKRAVTAQPAKKPAQPAKKAAQPAKKSAQAPKKAVAEPPKETGRPAKKAARAPEKAEAEPAKRTGRPARKALEPAKQAPEARKGAVTPPKKAAPAAKKAAAPAKAAARPARAAAAPARAAAAPAKKTTPQQAALAPSTPQPRKRSTEPARDASPAKAQAAPKQPASRAKKTTPAPR